MARRAFPVAGLLLASANVAPGLAQQRGWTPVIVSSIGTAAGRSRDVESLPSQPPVVPRRNTGLKPADAKPVHSPGSAGGASPADKRQTAAASNVESKTASSREQPVPVEPSKKEGQLAADATPAQQYCVNIADAAADARFAWQAKTLTDMAKDIDTRIAKLEEKTAEYQKWLARRDEFSKNAQQNLVGIFARMRPDAAALQFAAMNEETAAALLNKLDARISSAILAEMEPGQAARLAQTIAGAAKVSPDRSAKADPDGKKS